MEYKDIQGGPQRTYTLPHFKTLIERCIKRCHDEQVESFEENGYIYTLRYDDGEPVVTRTIKPYVISVPVSQDKPPTLRKIEEEIKVDVDETYDRRRARALDRYDQYRNQLTGKYLVKLDQAIERRYVDLTEFVSIVAKQTLLEPYEQYCLSHQLPTIKVLKTGRQYVVGIELYIDPLYNPTNLDINDPQFRVMMLLAHNYSYSQGHVELRQVGIEQAEKVVQHLLAWYDRCHAAQKEEEEKHGE